VVLFLTAPLLPLRDPDRQRRSTLTQRQWGTLSRMSAYLMLQVANLEMSVQLGAGGVVAQGGSVSLVDHAVLRVTFLSALALEWVATISTAVWCGWSAPVVWASF
jgi:ABC-type transport system involved in cytochrome bd biosynthesis fused ATPase/permease subunit